MFRAFSATRSICDAVRSQPVDATQAFQHIHPQAGEMPVYRRGLRSQRFKVAADPLAGPRFCSEVHLAGQVLAEGLEELDWTIAGDVARTPLG